MASIKLIDTTVRDGNQSLWGATGLTTAMMLEIAPVMDQVGFKAIDFITSSHMAVAVRYHKEDPWERIRLMRARMPKTPLSLLTTTLRFISWDVAHSEMMRLVFRLMMQNGISRFAVMDPMNDMNAVCATARLMREEGATDIVAALVYTVSPVHDAAFFARCAAAVASSPYIDGVYLKDPGGLLSADQAKTLLPAIRGQLRHQPLELHSHCTIGLAPFSYIEAANLGIDILHVAVTPLANGTSQPSAERTIANLRELGHEVDIDDRMLARMSDYFATLARAEGLPVGTPQEYDAGYFRHQLPGGMVATMRRQLREIRMLDRLPAVLEEVARVRAELGYPIMVTPLSQVVGTQAVLNIVSSERYANVPDEVIRYVIGRFGSPAVPIDENVRDRILSLPRTRELAAEPPMPELAELRRRFGPTLPDEEFVLRVVMPQDQIDAMKAAGPCRRTYDPAARPVIALLRELAQRRDLTHAIVEKPGFRLELKSKRRHDQQTNGLFS